MTEDEAKEARQILFELHAWGRCFIEDTPISAETLWREFPAKMAKAKEFLERTNETTV